MTPAEPHRLTPTERLHEVTMAALNRQPQPPEHSVEVTRNAKGAHQYQVTVRGYELEQVVADALATARQLDATIPYENDGVTSDPAEKTARAAAAIARAKAKS